MKYYVYDIRKKYAYAFSDWEELIGWFAQFNRTIGRTVHNPLLDEISLNFHDRKVEYEWERNGYHPVLVPRTLVVLDEYGRIIDIRLFKNEIIHYCPNQKKKGSRYHSKGFRKDPVPYTGCFRKEFFRTPRTFNEKRQSFDPEIQAYIRPKRKPQNLVDSWEDIPRHSDRSWKNQKIRKQWMKHLE